MTANPTFETAGPAQGSAAGWVSGSTATLVQVGTYGAGGQVTPWDGFEGSWGNDVHLAGLPGSAPKALYGPPPAPLVAESYERGWFANLLDLYVFELAGVTFFAPAVDGFEASWGNTPFFSTLGAVVALPVESFESGTGWPSTGFTSSLPSPSFFSFGTASGPSAVEGFVDVFAPVPFVVDPPADTIEAQGVPSFGLTIAARVVFLDSDSGQLPAPLSVDQTYYVSALPTASTIRVSESNTLSPDVDIADFSVGLVYVARDPGAYWYEVLA